MKYIYDTLFENSKDGANQAAEYIISQIDAHDEKYLINETKVSSVFIAWAPGSGKTEFLETIQDHEDYVVIDIDKYRRYFKWYDGSNSSEYQDACSRVATKVLHHCLKKDLKFILDGTVSSERWLQSVGKAYKKWRKIMLVLIYQAPTVSYSATLIRNVDKQRQVDIESFLRIYYNSVKYSFKALEKYPEIWFIVASKNKDGSYKHVKGTIPKDFFDKEYKFEHNRDVLKEKLTSIQNENISDWKKRLSK